MATSAGAKGLSAKPDFWRFIAGLVIFSAVFGYVEAAVVVYLRSIYTPLRAHFYSVNPGELFPLLTLEQLRSLSENVGRLTIELGRELATLLMLAGVATIAVRSLREWVAAFVVCFGHLGHYVLFVSQAPGRLACFLADLGHPLSSSRALDRARGRTRNRLALYDRQRIAPALARVQQQTNSHQWVARESDRSWRDVCSCSVHVGFP